MADAVPTDAVPTDAVPTDAVPTGPMPTDAMPTEPVPVGRVTVGRVGRPQGIKGEVTVEVRTDDPDGRFAVGSRFEGRTGALEVTRQRWQGQRLVLSFAGVADRDAAELLRETLLTVDPALDPALEDPDDFYDHQLVGLAARTTTGTALGTVTDVLHPPGGDLLVIEPAAGATDASVGEPGELLVPFVRAIVTAVDLPGGCITVDPPEGLLDL